MRAAMQADLNARQLSSGTSGRLCRARPSRILLASAAIVLDFCRNHNLYMSSQRDRDKIDI